MENEKLLTFLSEGSFDPNLSRSPLTHPPSYDFKHVESLEAFGKDLSRALQGAFPTKTERYDGVYSLLVDWEDDDLGCASEIEDLAVQLRNQFRFTTEPFSIPSLNSERAMQDKLIDVERANRDGHKLLIIYYGGHGQFNSQGYSIWRANRSQTSATLNWYLLQPILERSPCDVLFIFDCCFAASAARSAPDGTTELLAACGRENITSGVGDHSFTRVLMQELATFGSNPFTVAQLHTRLIKERSKLLFTPIHAFISDGNHHSIELAPLTPLDNILVLPTAPIGSASTNSAASTPMSFDSESSKSTTPTTPSKSPLPQEPRVLLAVSLQHTADILDLESWTRWLTSEAPQGIQNIDVKVEAAFTSNSTLSLISVPISIWNVLPETSAYRFIDYIKSTNLLISQPGRTEDISVRPKAEAVGLSDDEEPTPHAQQTFRWPKTPPNVSKVTFADSQKGSKFRTVGVRMKKAAEHLLGSGPKKQSSSSAIDNKGKKKEPQPIPSSASNYEPMIVRPASPDPSRDDLSSISDGSEIEPIFSPVVTPIEADTPQYTRTPQSDEE